MPKARSTLILVAALIGFPSFFGCGSKKESSNNVAYQQCYYSYEQGQVHGQNYQTYGVPVTMYDYYANNPGDCQLGINYSNYEPDPGPDAPMKYEFRGDIVLHNADWATTYEMFLKDIGFCFDGNCANFTRKATFILRTQTLAPRTRYELWVKVYPNAIMLNAETPGQEIKIDLDRFRVIKYTDGNIRMESMDNQNGMVVHVHGLDLTNTNPVLEIFYQKRGQMVALNIPRQP